MDTTMKPTQFKHIEYEIWGNGNPGWSDPRNVCDRELSRHIMYLCSQKPYSAKELSEELNVPMMYIEDEISILKKGQFDRYGVLREIKEGRYAMNFVLLSKEQVERAWNIYKKNTAFLCDVVSKYVKEHEKEYLSLPYLNKNVTFNAILWSQIQNIGYIFNRKVKTILSEKYFQNVQTPNRHFLHTAGNILEKRGLEGVMVQLPITFSAIQKLMLKTFTATPKNCQSKSISAAVST